MEKKRAIFFISDSTAITAHTLGMSLLSQFDGIFFEQTILPFINTVERARQAVTRINKAAKRLGTRPILFCTLIDPEIRKVIMTSEGTVFDFFDTFLDRLENELRAESTHAVGRYHGIVDNSMYDIRMDAVNYALENDDGVSTKYLDKADIILIGVSRTGKTPTCLFLALHFGLYAANYPLTEEDVKDLTYVLPWSLQSYRKKLFGLTINPERLQKIRTMRRPGSRYASITQCKAEVAMAEALFLREQIPFINVTTMSIEEIAATLIRTRKLECRL